MSYMRGIPLDKQRKGPLPTSFRGMARDFKPAVAVTTDEAAARKQSEIDYYENVDPSFARRLRARRLLGVELPVKH